MFVSLYSAVFWCPAMWVFVFFLCIFKYIMPGLTWEWDWEWDGEHITRPISPSIIIIIYIYILVDWTLTQTSIYLSCHRIDLSMASDGCASAWVCRRIKNWDGMGWIVVIHRAEDDIGDETSWLQEQALYLARQKNHVYNRGLTWMCGAADLNRPWAPQLG